MTAHRPHHIHIVFRSFLIPWILFCLLSGCSAGSVSEVPEYSISYTEADMSGYRNMEGKDHMFREIRFETLIDLFRHQGSAVVWISRTNCPYCQNAVWILNDAAEDAGIPVYYINADSPMSQNGTMEENQRLYEELCGYIQEALRTDETGTLTMYVPLLMNIQSGILINYHVSLTDSFSLSDSDTLSEKETEELYNIYRSVLE